MAKSSFASNLPLLGLIQEGVIKDLGVALCLWLASFDRHAELVPHAHLQV